MALSLIFARAENRCIGSNGALPWSLPDELAHFIRTVSGKALIMGRKTYQDPHAYHSDRLKLVISRNPGLRVNAGFERVSSLGEAQQRVESRAQEAYVIGGAGLIAEALPLATRVYETVVHANIEGDTYLDAFDFSGWESTVLQQHAVDEAHAHAYTVYRHLRQL